MGMAPVAHVLFNKFMNFNPKNPDWANRDRFVLSYVLNCIFRGTLLPEMPLCPLGESHAS
jgi:transketolase